MITNPNEKKKKPPTISNDAMLAVAKLASDSVRFNWRVKAMLKPHGTLRLKKNPQHRRKAIFWSATFQIILQTITFVGGAVTYHNTFLTQSMSESYEQGYGNGYRHAHDLYAPKSK